MWDTVIHNSQEFITEHNEECKPSALGMYVVLRGEMEYYVHKLALPHIVSFLTMLDLILDFG